MKINYRRTINNGFKYLQIGEKIRRFLRSITVYLFVNLVYIGTFSSQAMAQGAGGGGGVGGGVGGGGAATGRGDSGDEALLFFLIFFFFFLYMTGMIKNTASSSKQQNLVNIVILLPQGSYYVEQINILTANAKFSTHEGRIEFMGRLVNLVRSNAVDGWVRIDQPTENANNTAKVLWEKQMRSAEVQTVVLNVSPPEGSKQYQDKRQQTPSPEVMEESYCLLGLILTVPENQTGEALDFKNLQILPKIFTQDNVFYYWFGPNTAGIPHSEAQRLFTKISSVYS